MTYTAENITNIKRDGKMDSYIAMERELVAKLENAALEYDLQGEDSVSLAHLYGRYGIEVETAAPSAVAHIIAGSDWVGRWSLASFDNDQIRARAYAKAALTNQLKSAADQILAAAKGRLASLTAAA